MRVMLTLAAIPLITYGFGWVMQQPASAPLEEKPVAIEGVRVARLDDSSFRHRWSVVSDMPPMTERIYEPLLLVADAEPPSRATAGATVRPSLERRVSLRRLDVCARHNMRRVNYGRTWRCRR